MNGWVVDLPIDGRDFGVTLGGAKRDDPGEVPLPVDETLKRPTRIAVASALCRPNISCAKALHIRRGVKIGLLVQSETVGVIHVV